MNKILFITTRNILNTCGELRLIKNRTKTLYDKWNVSTDFIVICDRKKINSNNESMGNHSTVTSILYRIANPFSILKALIKGREVIAQYIRQEQYKCVILSGLGMLIYTPIVKSVKPGIPVIADIHGAPEELLEYNQGNIFKKFVKRLLYYCEIYINKKYLPKVDGAMVVSNALAKHLNCKYNLNNYKYYIVPCAVTNYDINYEKWRKNREKYRKKYKIKEDEILFIYSGGVSPWQCIEKSIKLFNNIKSKIKAKMLILSHQWTKIEPMISNHENIILDSVNPEEVNNVLCAGDYAFLIRDDFITNHVSFPNKFLEYVQSGMEIITTPFIFDIKEYIISCGMGIVINFDKEDVERIINYIYSKQRENVLENWESRRSFLNKLSFEETLKDFVNDFLF